MRRRREEEEEREGENMVLWRVPARRRWRGGRPRCPEMVPELIRGVPIAIPGTTNHF